MNELSWTSAAFTLAFIHLPLLFVACYRPRKLTAVPMKSDPRQRQLIFGLVGATILSDAVIAACWQLAPAIIGHLWILFFPLWFGLAMPWMVRRFPSTGNPHPPTALIWVGAGGGSLLGIAGGIFGTLIGTRQAALIEQARPSPPPHANHEKLA